MNELRRIDLNLLLTLHALLDEKHVSRAAVRLHKSQPAVSHALAQLREHFNDPLLIRKSGAMILTPYAQSLLTPLAEALENLNSLLAKSEFDPATAKRRFRLGMSDYAAAIILPTVVKHLRHHAPNIELAISQASREAMLLQLADGELDLAFSPFAQEKIPADIHIRQLFDEHFVCITDRKNLPEGGFDLADWLTRPHITLGLNHNSQDEIEHALSTQGHTRLPTAVTLPHWGAALNLLPDTDLILTIARRISRNLSAHPKLQAFPPPIALPTLPYHQAWHARKENDAAHRWLRETIAELSA